MTGTVILHRRRITLYTLFLGLAGLLFFLSATIAATEEKYFEMDKLTISDDPVINTGWKVYRVKCAVCHGSEGVGDGPMADIMITKPADLTTIARRYGGDFPDQAIHEMIDGRHVPLAHGTREMPIWGKELATEAAGIEEEALVKSRIRALLAYLKSIQK